jgi:putative ABC transport system permease protein
MMHWLRNLFFRKRANDDLAEEMEQHMAERTAALIEQGRDPEEAAREARRAFGNITLARERSVEVWQWRWLENLWADLRFALHQLRKSPGYTLTAILTLAIGIGANAAIFTLIDDIMLRSLPVPHPEQLVEIGFRSPATPYFMSGQSIHGLAQLRQNTHSLEDICGWSGNMVFVADHQGTLRSIYGAFVTGNALSLLGVRPYLGRLLTPADDVPGGPDGGWPVVLDYGFWLANYNGDPSVLGKPIRVSGKPAVIVGVLPPEFTGIYPHTPQKVYLPSRFVSTLAASRGEDPMQPDIPSMVAIGRLRPGISLERLNIELATGSAAFMKAFMAPAMKDRPDLRNATLAAQPAGRGFAYMEQHAYRQPLLLLQCIVLLVLLMCCINLGGLQVARVQTRRHEFALRAALGAGRGRILQQCLTESLLLAIAGSALAAIIAYDSTAAFGSFLTPAGSVETTVLRPDARVLVFTLALALITTLLFGLMPALLAGRVSPGTLLNAKGMQQRSGTLRRRVIIPAQFAISLVLVLAAGLFSRTLQRLRSNNGAIDTAHVMMVTAQFQFLKKTPAELDALYRAMTNDLRNVPGVQAATYTWVSPLSGFAPLATMHSLARAPEDHLVAFDDIGSGYFDALNMHLLAGRSFNTGDRDRSTCVVNQSAAHMLFPTGAALDNEIKAVVNGNDMYLHLDATCRIVGLVGDVPYATLRDPTEPIVYFPITAASFHGSYSNNMVFMIRSQTDAEAIAAYRATLARFAPNTGVMSFLPLRDQVDQSLGSERLIAMLSTVFAAIALLLSAIGIFGLLALRVQERTPEFGVRIAVGATRGHLLKIVLSDALRMVAIGSVCGLVLAGIGYLFIRRFLYGASPADIRVALASLAVLIVVALIAAAIPAHRAASLDPTQALRAE